MTNREIGALGIALRALMKNGLIDDANEVIEFMATGKSKDEGKESVED